MNDSNFITSSGYPQPYGITKSRKGCNFAVFSKSAHAVTLCLFKQDESIPFSLIPLDSKKNRTGNVWHINVHNLPENLNYAYKIDPSIEADENKKERQPQYLLDPYACEVMNLEEKSPG